jgi:DNA-binding HxlR family transcriptional regulator
MAKEELRLVSQKNRAEILQTLLATPLHFSELLRRLKPMSSRTLSKHLKSLENESLISAKIEGRKVVFEANKPRTILQLRKEYLQQLSSLLSVYASALNQKTEIITQDYLNTLKESIDKPESEALTTKSFRKTFKLPKIPEGSEGIVKVPISNLYEKAEISIRKKQIEEPTSMSDSRFYGKREEPDLKVDVLKLKRKGKKVKNVLGKGENNES